MRIIYCGHTMNKTAFTYAVLVFFLTGRQFPPAGKTRQHLPDSQRYTLPPFFPRQPFCPPHAPFPPAKSGNAHAKFSGM
jgi:hypothetical protein